MIYGNVALAYLMAGKLDRAEGYFLESAMHYTTIGDFDGIARMYFMLFDMRDRLLKKTRLTDARLYDAAFFTWGYARPPLLLPGMVAINERYFDHALKKRIASEAARAIDDRGYLLRDSDGEERIGAARDLIRRFMARFGERVAHEQLFPRLRQSSWWPELA